MNKKSLGSLRLLFKIVDGGPSMEKVCAENTVFSRSRCYLEMHEALQKDLGLGLTEEQRHVLQALGTERRQLFPIRALAGAGKTMLVTCILKCILPGVSPLGAVLLLVPHRELLAQVCQNLRSTFPGLLYLMLGRPLEDGGPDAESFCGANLMIVLCSTNRSWMTWKRERFQLWRSVQQIPFCRE